MTKREEEEGHHHLLNGNGDDSPIIVGDSSTGVLRHMTAIPANSIYVAFETCAIGSNGVMSVSHATSNPYQVGPTRGQRKVNENWTLVIYAGGVVVVTISSTNGIVVKVTPGIDPPSVSPQKSNAQFPNGYVLLVFSNGPITSAVLNGVNVFVAATTVEVDFH